MKVPISALQKRIVNVRDALDTLLIYSPDSENMQECISFCECGFVCVLVALYAYKSQGWVSDMHAYHAR